MTSASKSKMTGRYPSHCHVAKLSLKTPKVQEMRGKLGSPAQQINEMSQAVTLYSRLT